MALLFQYCSFIAVTTIVMCLSFSQMMSAQDTGTATFYTPPYQPSACYGFEDDGVMIAAASDEFWNDGGVCGQMYEVSCLSGTNTGVPFPCKDGVVVTVKIVDYCPSGCRGTIDLSQEAFASIADPDAGKINISYQQVEV